MNKKWSNLNVKSLAISGLAITLVIVAGWVAYMSRSRSSSLHIDQSVSGIPMRVGQKVPLFSGKTIDGEDYRFEPQVSEKAVVVFWASWCPPCLKETPSLIDLAKRRPNWKVVAISNDSNLAAINEFIKMFPGMRRENIVLVWDSSRELANAYGLKALPESFLVDPEGRLLQKFEGAVDWAKF